MGVLTRKMWAARSAAKRTRAALVLACALPLSAAQAEEAFCDDRPSAGASVSLGRPSRGSVVGALALEDSDAVRILPVRHRRRCLNWGVARLVQALRTAGEDVRRAVPGSPPLGVGNIGRAGGGSIAPYSRSHHAGRDADVAFYQVDLNGQPAPAADLQRFGADLRSLDGRFVFDVPRNWVFVRSLLTNPAIQVKWIFVSLPLRRALLDEARRTGATQALIDRASDVLHQPTDAPPHDDHFHVRIACTAAERRAGCL